MGIRLQLNNPSPDFELHDTQGELIKLSQFTGEKNVVLVLNRGFV